MNLNRFTQLLIAVPLLIPVFSGEAGSVPFESKRFVPYFDMYVSQGAYLPSSGNFFTGANMRMSVGMNSKIIENHSLFGLYNLGFSGQAFRFPDTREFASKELSHRFDFEYRWQITKSFRVRPGVAYGTNFTRTAAGEIWGEGLYDSDSIGGQLAGDYAFDLMGKEMVVTGKWLFRDIDFPNYTDIIREFQGLDANTELAGGLKDQKFHQFGIVVNWNKLFSRFRYSIQNFQNERVVEPSGTFGNTKQKDTRIFFSGGRHTKLWIFETSPEAGYSLHRSNQNFLLFQSVTDPSPLFAGNYYDYNELNLSFPFFVNFTKKWALSLGLDYRRRSYSDRQPREGTNTFIAGKTQKNNMITFTGGIRKKLNEISEMTLTYSSVVATSNNKFERYLPYNYTGQSISLSYRLTY